jgi:hypothetical protein
MAPRSRKYRPSLTDRNQVDVEEWLAVFEDEDCLDIRPPRSGLSGQEILDEVMRYLADPAGPCAEKRLVGNQCELAAGEATSKELFQVLGDRCWHGAAKLIVQYAANMLDNRWATHPLRCRKWQPSGSGLPWIIFRLASASELASEAERSDADREVYRAMVEAMDSEKDPEADPNWMPPQADLWSPWRMRRTE